MLTSRHLVAFGQRPPGGELTIITPEEESMTLPTSADDPQFDHPCPAGVDQAFWEWARAHDRFIADWRGQYDGDVTGATEAFRQTEEHARLHAAAFPETVTN